MITEKELLHYIGKQPRHIAGYKQIVHDLALKGRQRRDLEDLLRDMTRRRKLVAIGKERWSLPTPSSNQDLLTGTLRMHRDGYGFVTPDPGSLPPRAQGVGGKPKLAGDVFIPPPAVGSAMDGDQVLVELGPVRPDGRAEGRILRVNERKHETVVGKFHLGSRHNYVTPIDDKLAVEIIIPPGMEVPAPAQLATEGSSSPHSAISSTSAKSTSSSPSRRAPSPERPRRQSPHRVLGEEAQRHASFNDLEGTVVEVEIIQWPSAAPVRGKAELRGRVVEVLGREDDFGIDVEIIIRKHHLRHSFPPAVLEEAQRISPLIAHNEIQRRKDYRSLPIVTIDGETARDFDDAVLVTRLPNGNYELQVHIADVAHYVQEDSEIDFEARLRGTSVYFPDRAVPMLPLELSTDLCSLRPEVERLVLSCVMEITPQGEIAGYELGEGIIRSAARMTYTDVNAIIEGDKTLRSKYAALAANFDLMYELAQILNRKRVKRGSIDFDLPEPMIEFDDFGLMKTITPSERNWAHRLIEEFMLAANETVAGHLEQRVASIYRIHEKPEPRRIYDFETIAAGFGYSLGVGALPVQRIQVHGDRSRHVQGRGSGGRHHGQSRGGPAPRSTSILELPEEVHVTPRMYQKLVQKIAGKPEERILSFLMLRSLKQARYSEINEGHFALAAPVYTHFTSPIRRYPDLIVHRILKSVLREGETRELYEPERRVSPWSEESTSQRTGSTPKSSKSIRRGRQGRNDALERQTDGGRPLHHVPGLTEETLHDIAETSSQTERAADEAERELLEWKKLKFMEDRLGETFDGLIVSVTKFGFFVELIDMFIEGLVPLTSLEDDHYTFRDNTRQIIGSRTRKMYSIGDRIKVLVDRIDHLERKIQFAPVEERPQQTTKGKKARRR